MRLFLLITLLLKSINAEPEENLMQSLEFSQLRDQGAIDRQEPPAVASESIDTRIARGISLHEAGDLAGAKSVLRQVVMDTEMTNLKARYFLAKVYCAMLKSPEFAQDKQDIRTNAINHLTAVSGSIESGEYQEPARRLLLEAQSGSADYNATYGRKIADNISKAWYKGACATSSSRGHCYGCVYDALQLTTGGDPFSGDTNTRLNPPPYSAKFFATGWKQEVDGPKLGLHRSFYSRVKFREGEELAVAAPIGSVIVWDRCGQSAHGHIAVKTSATNACSDFCAPVKDTCGTTYQGHQRVIAVFIPVGK